MKSQEKIDNFLKDIKLLCIKHQLSIAHEDRHGGFLIENYNINNIKWLSAAFNNTK